MSLEEKTHPIVRNNNSLKLEDTITITISIDVLTSTEIFNGKKWVNGPEMPLKRWYHCQVTLSDNEVFFSGGLEIELISGHGTQKHKTVKFLFNQFLVLQVCSQRGF